MRGAKRTGTRYFGPYAHAWAIRETVDLLLRVFPVRTCSAGVFKRAHQQGRPCLLGYIDKCSAPCVGRISPDDHHALAEDFCDFMAGDTAKFTRRLDGAHARGGVEPWTTSRRPGCATTSRRSSARPRRTPSCSQDGTDADVFALVGDELEAAVQVFHVRDGRIRGQRGWIVEKVEDVTDGELVEHLLQQVYGAEEEALAGSGSRSRGEPAAAATRPASSRARCSSRCCRRTSPQVAAWLSGLRGSRVDVRVPQRGDKRELAETVRRNAEHALVLHRTRRAGRPDDPQPGAARDPGGARPADGAAAHRVLRRLAPRRARTSRRRWSCSRTAWRARASTGRSPSAGRRARARATTPPRCTRSSPAGSGGTSPTASGPATSRSAAGDDDDRLALDDGRRGGEVPPRSQAARALRVPAEPRRGRRRPAAGRRGRARAGRARRRRRRAVRAGQAARGGVAAGGGVPGHPPAQLRGPVPAAAGARRGAPVRDHRAPPAAGARA